ncbi:MAG TPA: magnesium transporter CorA family protein [Bacteroidia bacterium]|nr:magnesium transporter CorA family protein [Bacteroidia bacterium]
MSQAYAIRNGRLCKTENPEEAAWIDLLSPNREEEKSLESFLGIELPTREDMEEIEISSRLYEEDGGIFMTVQLPSATDGGNSIMGPVTFILIGHRLITIRYHDPRSFAIFAARAARTQTAGESGETVFLGLLETIVDRLADIIERAGRNVLPISKGIFQNDTSQALRSVQHRSYLETIGRTGDLISDIRDSLMTLDRAVGFYAQHILRKPDTETQRARIKTITRDLHSIGDHAGFLSGKITLLLDATLGMIGIEQNGIIKIFSVAAVVFLPPTLVASIYGMNFEVMPELKWPLGYPFAIGLMILSALLPYWFFKRKGWL